MLPGPIYRVELVAVARRRRYFALRVLYALLILLLLWTTYSSSYYLRSSGGAPSIQHSATLAASFFMSFTWLQMLAILFVGPAMAAGTIATERERRTIEYLFATDLTNAEIVLGKTLARLTLLGQFVLVGLPILFIFRLMGGIPAQALLATFLSAAGTALMLTGISIVISVWTPKARDAIGRVYLLLIALFSVPPILYTFVRLRFFGMGFVSQTLGQIADLLLLVNPLSATMNAMGRSSAVGFGLDMQMILESVGMQCLVGAVCLALATFAVRRVHLAETTRTAEKQVKTRGRRHRPVGEHAMLWKEMYSSASASKLGRIGRLALSVILLGLFIIAVWVFWTSLTAAEEWRRNDYFEFLIGLTGYLGTGLLLLVSARSAGLMSYEKERDCWITLLSTPLTGREIVVGKLCGNVYYAKWMLFILAAAWLLGMILDVTAIWPALVSCVMFCLMTIYCTCVGLLFSLRSATTLRAMGLTLGTLMFFGGGYLFCCCTVMVDSRGGGDEWELILALCIPFLLLFPSVAYLSSDQMDYFWNHSNVSAAFVIGTLVYTVAAAVVYMHTVANFDRYAGRTVPPTGDTNRPALPGAVT
jgi:ABC-type transport system involved in multi-copper enzyme maturation permease subunit